mgnify:CR=1 FL=1
MKILSNKKYNELKGYKEKYNKVVEDNTELKLELSEAKADNATYYEQVEYLRAEIAKYQKPKKKAGRPKKATTEDKPKRKAGRPRKESK